MSTASRLLPVTTAAADGVTINAEQGLFVIPCFGGYTCLGFEVAERIRAAVAAWCGLSQAVPPVGTLDSYRAYDAAMTRGAEHHRRTRTRCPAELSPQLVGLEGARVEVLDAAGGTPRRFNVGRSDGWMPCHLEIARNGARGGPAASRSYFAVRVVRSAGR